MSLRQFTTYILRNLIDQQYTASISESINQSASNNQSASGGELVGEQGFDLCLTMIIKWPASLGHNEQVPASIVVQYSSGHVTEANFWREEHKSHFRPICTLVESLWAYANSILTVRYTTHTLTSKRFLFGRTNIT